jgi:hypothetical protein
MKKAIITLAIILSILIIVFIISVLVFNTSNSNEQDSIDDRALFIGTSKYSTTNTNVTDCNIIYIQVYDNLNLVFNTKVMTQSDILVPGDYFSSELSSYVFYDLSEVMKTITKNLNINSWHLKSPNKNYISIQIEFSSAPILSLLDSANNIGDSGIYLFTTPINNNDPITYSHAYIYKHIEVSFL